MDVKLMMMMIQLRKISDHFLSEINLKFGCL